MALADKGEQRNLIYPISGDRRWHGGCHIASGSQNEAVRAIADGEVVAYRVCQHLDGPDGAVKDSDIGFVLLRHETETGVNRRLRFYSLYMHLRHLGGYGGNCNPKDLPEWLRMPTGVASGEGKKVCRKDILGWIGQCNGDKYLHFEIFMARADFEAYFNETQLGRATPSTPASTDYWGDSYYVIPAGLPILAQPPGTSKDKLNGVEFPPLQGIAATDRKLYIEVKFRGGQRLTRVWRDDAEGQRTLLTAQPILEKDYEYDMYARACALYPACPSDGYELLRFGRILSRPETLPAGNRATWFRVAFDQDKQGYIDIHNAGIQKLSDADFPSFMGWEKVSEVTGPFAQDGLCDIDLLKNLLKDKNPGHNPHVGSSVNKALRYYVQMGEGVRERLRGLVCEMPSEWDRSNNEARYRKLKEPGEFYAGDPAGYERFMALVDKAQFWDKTGLPPTSTEKLWFFHPLVFIRHFRKCGWLDLNELSSTFPRHLFYSSGGNPRSAIVTPESLYSLGKNDAKNRVSVYLVALNTCIRKYLGHERRRIAVFLAQTLLETAQWRNLGGTRRLMHEWGFGKYSAANPATQYYGPFYGRGIMQLTWAGNYDRYSQFRALPEHPGAYMERAPKTLPRITETSKHYTFHPGDGGREITWSPRFDPDSVAEDANAACDSGGFYWVSKPFSKGININRVADLEYSAQNVGFINALVNGGGNGYYERQAYTIFMMRVLLDGVDREATVVVPAHKRKSSVQVSMLAPE
ncbi:peptidase M23 [Cupriavidus sp. SIMBA_020]